MTWTSSNFDRGGPGKDASGKGQGRATAKGAVMLLWVFVPLLAAGTGNGLADGPVKPRVKPPSAEADQPEAVPAPPQTGLVSLNFTGADLVEVIHVLAQYLKLNYTIDPAVRGTVTLYSAQPLRREDLLPVFHQVLRMNSAVAVKAGDFYHIAPIKDGKGLARPVKRVGQHGYALQVVPVRFFSVAELKKLLEPFVTPGGEIIEYPRGNFLIIVDLHSNIRRLVEIQQLIDVNVFAGARMEIYQPEVASAEELAEEMGRIMQAYAASSTQPESFVAQFIPIPRINRLLVISHSEAAWTYAKRWLEQIDTYAEGPGRRIFVYPVENGTATDLANILSQVLGVAPVGPRAPRRTLKDVHERVPGGQLPLPTPPGAPSAGQTGGSTGQTPGIYAVAPAQPARPPTRARPEARAAPPTAPPAGPEDQIRIVPDPATNSLIIFGTAQEFQNIKNILKEIDIIPRQVLMDVMVAEVTLQDDLRFGLEYEIRRKGGDVRIFDREFGSRASILSGLAGPTTAGGPGPQALSAVIGTGDAVRAFLNARREDSRIKVLSSPSILATDNRPARIQVGTEEPIPTGTVQSPVAAGTITSSTTIQYRNTGRILTIIPQVNAQGLVHLQVKTEVSQRGAGVTVGQDTFPSFDTRDAETTAVVQDGETLVIGGIITERVDRNRIGIPFLMDVPVLGRFFGTTTDDIDRTELIILITPHVMRDKEEARTVTEEFKERLRRVVKEYEREIKKLQRGKKKGEEKMEKETVPEQRDDSRTSIPSSAPTEELYLREKRPPIPGARTSPVQGRTASVSEETASSPKEQLTTLIKEFELEEDEGEEVMEETVLDQRDGSTMLVQEETDRSTSRLSTGESAEELRVAVWSGPEPMALDNEAVSSVPTEEPSSREKPALSTGREAPAPEQTVSVTTVTVTKERLSALTPVSLPDPTELSGEKLASSTSPSVSTEELSLGEELADSAAGGKASASKETGWSPLQWFSGVIKSLTSVQEGTEGSPKEPTEMAQAGHASKPSAQQETKENPEEARAPSPSGPEAMAASDDDAPLLKPTEELYAKPELADSVAAKTASVPKETARFSLERVSAVIKESEMEKKEREEKMEEEEISPRGEIAPIRLADSAVGRKASAPQKTGLSPARTENKTSLAKDAPHANKARKEAATRKGAHRAVWSVQVNAFSQKRDAISLAKKLRDSGYDAYVVIGRIKGRRWYRVRVGHLTDLKEARALHEALKKKEKYTQAYLTATKR